MIKYLIIICILCLNTLIAEIDINYKLITQGFQLQSNREFIHEIKRDVSFYFINDESTKLTCTFLEGNNVLFTMEKEGNRLQFSEGRNVIVDYELIIGWNIVELEKVNSDVYLNNNELSNRNRIRLPISNKYNKIVCKGNSIIANFITDDKSIKNRPRTIIPIRNQQIIYE